MPTKHRNQMIEAGYAKKHHGHDPDAVAQMAALQAEDQAKLDAAADAAVAAAANADRELAVKRAKQAERHRLELEAMKAKKPR